MTLIIMNRFIIMDIFLYLLFLWLVLTREMGDGLFILDSTCANTILCPYYSMSNSRTRVPAATVCSLFITHHTT